MSDQERADLATMLSYLPELKTLRDFVDGLGILPLHDMQLDLEMSGRRLVDLRPAA